MPLVAPMRRMISFSFLRNAAATVMVLLIRKTATRSRMRMMPPESRVMTRFRRIRLETALLE